MLKEITTTKIDPNFIIKHESNEASILCYKVCAKSHSNKSFGRLINFKKADPDHYLPSSVFKKIKWYCL